MTWIVLLIGLAVAGLCLTFVGLRGRRVDAHPLCRRCGFDLTGTPDAAICNECGADLTRPRAVKLGHRARRRLPLTLGLGVLLPSLVVLGVLGYAAVRAVDWQQRKPQWWLARDLDAADPATSAAAYAELARRYDAGGLGDAAALAAADWVLGRQADLAVPWDFEWGRFVQRLRDDGRLDDARYGRFVVAAIGTHLVARPTVHQGDPLPTEIQFASRGPPGISWVGTFEWKSVAVGGKPLPTPTIGGRADLDAMGEFVYVGATISFVPLIGGEMTTALPPGPVEVGGTLWMRVFRQGPGDGKDVSGRTADVEGPVSVSATTDLRPPGDDAGLTYSDESVRGAVEAAVAAGRPGPWVSKPELFQVPVVVDPVPAVVSWRLFARYDGREIAAEVSAIKSQPRIVSRGVAFFKGEGADLLRRAAEEGGRVDLILRPAPDLAKKEVEITPIWDGEVTIPDVPVSGVPAEESEATYRPASRPGA